METINERQNWERFSALVLDERELFDRLRAASSHEDFVTLAVRLGAERGCVFTSPMVQAVLRERRQAWLERWL